jgi:hypothetical protein
MDFERQRFHRLAAANDLREVATMLERRPELALDPYAMSAEGILSMPANRRHVEMMALLMRHGARVPAMTKWAADYYFKYVEIAALLLERGMSARHMNCHRTTLLHEMARRGELTKASLLLDHGAEIDAVDDEFKSTPLGFAARWGQRGMVRLLLDHGADRRRAGAEWAEPAAWARKEGGHVMIAADLSLIQGFAPRTPDTLSRAPLRRRVSVRVAHSLSLVRSAPAVQDSCSRTPPVGLRSPLVNAF